MLHLTEEQHHIVQDLLRVHLPGQEVWAFGSRVHGNNLKQFSDLDLAIVDSNRLDAKRLAALQIAFAESDLPFRVDLVELDAVDTQFAQLITAQHEVVQSSRIQGP